MKRYADHEFTAETHATILALAAQLEAVIAEYPDHDAKHVRRIAKIGHKTAGFAREALDAAKANSELIPRGLDVDRFERALEQRNLLRTQLTQLSLLTEKVKTAMTLLGVDVYAYGLDVYSSLKRGKAPEVKATVQKLSRCFERKRRKKKCEGEQAQGAEAGAPPLTAAAQPMNGKPVPMSEPQPAAATTPLTSPASAAVPVANGGTADGQSRKGAQGIPLPPPRIAAPDLISGNTAAELRDSAPAKILAQLSAAACGRLAV